MKTKILAVAVAAALISSGITYTLVAKRAEPPSAVAADGGKSDSAKREGIEIPGLKTAPAVAGEGWDVLTATGKVNVPSARLVKISPRIEGKIVAAHGSVGDAVRAGQVLALISSVELADARSQYRQARARLDAARKNYEQELRMAGLGANSVRPVEESRAQNLESQGELSDAKAELAQVRSEVVRAESELAKCKALLDRAKDLYANKIVSRQDLESAEAEHKQDSAAVDAARSKVSQAEANVEKAKAKAEIAKQYLAREEKVYKGRLRDTRALQAARADVTSAKIEVQAAADRIRVLGANPEGSGETIAVTSPISGRIVSRQTNVGEVAGPEDAIFTVASMSTVWIEADVYEKDLAKARKGQTAEIRVDAYPGKVFIGRVDSISDMLSPESRTAKVRCVVANSQGLLKGEMFAKISLITSKRGSTVLIPKEAVLDEAGKKIVFTVCRECAEVDYEKIEVTTGPAHGDMVEILSGLRAGTEVVTVGAYQLKTALGSTKLKAGCADAECADD